MWVNDSCLGPILGSLVGIDGDLVGEVDFVAGRAREEREVVALIDCTVLGVDGVENVGASG
jgi:hypothetical protein